MTTSPDGTFMAQVARNLTDSVDGFLRGKKFLVIARDTKFTEAFRKTLAGAGGRDRAHCRSCAEHERRRRAVREDHQ